MDVGPDGPVPPQSFPINTQFSPPAFQSATNQAPRFAPREAPQEAPRPPPRLTLPRDVPPPTIEEVPEYNEQNVRKVQIKLLPTPQKVRLQPLSGLARRLATDYFLYRGKRKKDENENISERPQDHIVGIRDGPNASAEPFHIKVRLLQNFTVTAPRNTSVCPKSE
ncbi:hypothetical protein COOONC_16751 [Cooperia oncophora]